MEDNMMALAGENARLTEALRKISEHHAQIQKIIDGVSDLLVTEERVEAAHVTEEDVKQLLKKYSRLN